MTTFSQVKISRLTSFSLIAVMAIFATACGKKVVIPPPPPPPNNSGTGGGMTTPTAGKPVVASFSAEPSSIERGQSAQLSWAVTGATEISINRGIGTVTATGTRSITPTETTTWTLTATGPAGTTTSNATISVTNPAPPPPPPARNQNQIGTVGDRIQSDLQDILFDYDSNNLREESRAILQADAAALKRIFEDFPTTTIYVEGHCDERGSAEYNLGLGDRRASSAREFLTQQGVPVDRLKTISFGKERPTCTEATEGCFQKNRRAHFAAGQ
jgi:peptidoglycan-associated lipoprotein